MSSDIKESKAPAGLFLDPLVPLKQLEGKVCQILPLIKTHRRFLLLAAKLSLDTDASYLLVVWILA